MLELQENHGNKPGLIQGLNRGDESRIGQTPFQYAIIWGNIQYPFLSSQAISVAVSNCPTC